MQRVQVGCLLLVISWGTRSVAAQEFTARFFSYGSPLEGQRVLFSPDSKFLAVLVDDYRTHILEVETGRETQNVLFQPLAMEFADNSLGVLGISSRETLFVPVAGSLGLRVAWRPPPGYIGLTFDQQAGKIVVSAMAPGGPAAASREIQVGDELVGLVVAGHEVTVLGRSVPDVLRKLAGLPGSRAILQILPRNGQPQKTVTLRRAPGTKRNDVVTFRPDAARSARQAFVVRYENCLLIFDATEMELVSAVEPQDIESYGFQTFSPDGKLLAVTGQRRHPVEGEPGLALEVFDVVRQERLLSTPVPTRTIQQQRFTADGKRILWGAGDRILVYDWEHKAFAPPILIGFDPFLYVPQKKPENDNEFSPLYVQPRAATLNPRLEYEVAEAAKRVEYPEQLLASMDVSPDGTLVAVGSCRGELRIFATNRHKEFAKIGSRSLQETLVKPVAFSPNGKWLAYYLEGTLHWQTVASILQQHASP